MNPFSTTIVIAASIAGFCIASYIYFKKKTASPMTCPLKGRCEMVVESEYAHFLGMPVELLGMGYYAIIGATYSASVIMPTVAQSVWPLLSAGIVTLTITALLFSFYLTAIQAFIVRHWCTWCVTSALLCLIIGITVLTSSVDVLTFFQ